MGAMLGSVYGQAIHAVIPHVTSSAGAYGLFRIGAVFAASARIPITAVPIIYELTGEYTIILPLMLAIVIATAISARLSRDTIYTMKLRRRGIDLQTRTRPLLADVLVRDAMSATPAPVAWDARLQDVLERFATGPGSALPVIDAQHRLLGVITATNLQTALQDGHPTALVHPEDPLDNAIAALGHTSQDGLPVLDPSDQTIVGWISERDILANYRQRLQQTDQVELPAVVLKLGSDAGRVAREPDVLVRPLPLDAVWVPHPAQSALVAAQNAWVFDPDAVVRIAGGYEDALAAVVIWDDDVAAFRYHEAEANARLRRVKR